MKGKIKLIIIAGVLILLSTLLLLLGMSGVDTSKEKEKPQSTDPYYPGDREVVGIDMGGAYTLRSELSKKFSAMSKLDKETDTITVITREYLEEYWKSNYKEERSHTLSREEVYYIIENSIDIYSKYKNIVLVDFSCDPSAEKFFPEVAPRIPTVKGQIITPGDTEVHLNSDYTVSNLDKEEDIKNIYQIIMYRVTALSSPSAFFTGAEAVEYAGNNPDDYESAYLNSKIYFCEHLNYSTREYRLNTMGGNTMFKDCELLKNMFLFSCDTSEIQYGSYTYGNIIAKAYPTQEKRHGNDEIPFVEAAKKFKQ